MPTYKDINLLSQKSSVSGTEKLPVSDTEYITPEMIIGDVYDEIFRQNADTDWVDAGLDSVGKVNCFINSASNKWGTATNWYSKFLPVEQGKIYCVTAGPNGVTRYAFMTSNAYTMNAAVTTYATGYDSAIKVESGESTANLAPPENANYLYVLVQIGGSTMTGVSVNKADIAGTYGILKRIEIIEAYLGL